MKKILTIIGCTGILFAGISFANNLSPNPKDCPCLKKMEQSHLKKMEKKRATFFKRLNLDEQQQKQADELHNNAYKEIRPIIKELRQEKQVLFKLIDEDASESEIKEQNAKIKLLREKVKGLKNTHMDKLKAILNDKQKTEFEKIKKERKIKIQKLKKHGFHNLH